MRGKYKITKKTLLSLPYLVLGTLRFVVIVISERQRVSDRNATQEQLAG